MQSVGGGISGAGGNVARGVGNTTRGWGDGVKDSGNGIKDWTKAGGERKATTENPLGMRRG